MSLFISAIVHAKKSLPNPCRTVYLSPQGKSMTQWNLEQLVSEQQFSTFYCWAL